MLKTSKVLRHWIRPVSQKFCSTGLTDIPDISRLHSQLLTIEDVREKLRENVQYRQRFRYPRTPWPGDHPLEVKVTQSYLPPRRPRDSFVSCYIPMSDPAESIRYLNHGGSVRFGRFLEDLDTLAGVIYYKHDLNPLMKGVDNENSPYAFMTVLVDSIEHSKNQPAFDEDKDVYMNGKVTWVGTSSVECTMNIEQEVKGVIQKIISAKYVMVARNPASNRPVVGAGVVNPLLLETMQDLHAHNLAEDKRQRRKEKEKMSLLKQPPTEEERCIIHDMFLSTVDLTAGSFKKRRKPENSVWMKDTSLQTVITCHPEDGSVYNKIFGGFVMRKAHELASTVASIFSHGHAALCRSIDDVVFLRPVEIGDVLHLGATVVYTCASDVQVFVKVEKICPETNNYETTNDFHFTFDVGVDNLPSIVPLYYSEAMMYLRGRRYYKR